MLETEVKKLTAALEENSKVTSELVAVLKDAENIPEDIPAPAEPTEQPTIGGPTDQAPGMQAAPQIPTGENIFGGNAFGEPCLLQQIGAADKVLQSGFAEVPHMHLKLFADTGQQPCQIFGLDPGFPRGEPFNGAGRRLFFGS